MWFLGFGLRYVTDVTVLGLAVVIFSAAITGAGGDLIALADSMIT